MGILVYGGSFNPLHIGHMRLAIEALETFKDVAENIDFVPSASPPHKDNAFLLPFDLRMEMVRQTLAGEVRMNCNDLEGRRAGPSYTYDTLRIYQENHRPEDIYFILGSKDYALLDQWFKGLELPMLCHLVIAPRGEFSLLDFERATREFWPDCGSVGLGICNLPCIDVKKGCEIVYAPFPYLDISASCIREIWLKGKSLKYLVPDAALRLLEEHKNTALECWREAN